MKEIKVAVSDVLANLKKNRATHIADYAEAVIGFQEKLIKDINDMGRMARKGGYTKTPMLQTVTPVSFVNEFDTAIAQLEWTTDKEVTLTAEEFRNYVQNNWSWSNAFAGSTSIYKGAK